MLRAINGFRHFETHHCVTGSMRHLYAFHGHDLSEDLLLGVGEGVGFAYFRFKGQPPFLGGRAQPKPSMEELAAERTGVRIVSHSSTSDAAAEKSLLRGLAEGRPAMLQVDMGSLPYFDFGEHEYHFGGHVIVACGYEPESKTVLVADRDRDLHPVRLCDLAAARGSPHKPFPPNRRWWDFDFSGFHPPGAAEVLESIRRQAGPMLNPPIANVGVRGIRKTAEEISRWDELLGPQGLRGALFNAWIFLSDTGGTGGGAFRRMFSRFLVEAAAISGRAPLKDAGAEFRAISDAWDDVAVRCRAASEAASRADMASHLPGISAAVLEIARKEERAWKGLTLML